MRKKHPKCPRYSNVISYNIMLNLPKCHKILACESMSKTIYILSTPFSSFLVIHHFILEKRKSSELCPRHDCLSFPMMLSVLMESDRVLCLCLFVCSLESLQTILVACFLFSQFFIPSPITPQAEFSVQLEYLSKVVFKLQQKYNFQHAKVLPGELVKNSGFWKSAPEILIHLIWGGIMESKILASTAGYSTV